MVKLDIQRVATITAPTLLMHGRDDRTAHFNSALVLARTIPNSRVYIVNRCGHCVQLEHTDKFNRAIDSFIEGNPVAVRQAQGTPVGPGDAAPGACRTRPWPGR
ncbi:alpha/beta fold hydrolase [Massilia varians]|uniref:alpha/beta fold hydrolase n=1 Tax=Massilia varians TaxID=457921 RepID=UPI002556D19B|nr:alpha/beta hydrolase [Massilia varians]MDK6076502.1 alpha/beta hydrolase [Massilia varians]